MDEKKLKIRKILADEAKVDESTIESDTLLGEDLLLNSLNFVKIIVDIESDLNITIPDDLLVMDIDITFDDFCNKILSAAGQPCA
ncbi:MAG TPA: phosphopantetheine-binding protein [Ruminiclostridium sp.]|nr:phosphopantetheine-binding protein [Ruminiclostridium sp.]